MAFTLCSALVENTGTAVGTCCTRCTLHSVNLAVLDSTLSPLLQITVPSWQRNATSCPAEPFSLIMAAQPSLGQALSSLPSEDDYPLSAMWSWGQSCQAAGCGAGQSGRWVLGRGSDTTDSAVLCSVAAAGNADKVPFTGGYCAFCPALFPVFYLLKSALCCCRGVQV